MRDLVMKAKGGSEREKKRVVQVKYRERFYNKCTPSSTN